MNRPRVIQLVALLACAGFVFLAGTRVAGINQGREELNLRGSESVIENAPPEYAFAVQVLGAFRSLITDIAFLRAEHYKQQGRHFDAMQLATWICTLQPHFPTVWEFASWNMAWNISVTTFTPEERWNWVYNGVKLLRDQGIKLNPRAINLYKQLAWTFNNKMSETLDDHHQAYKRYWAYRMHILLGAPPTALYAPPPEAAADEVSSPEQIDLLLAAAEQTAALHEDKRRRLAEIRGVEYEPLDREPDQYAGPESLTRRADQARAAAATWLQAIADAPRSLEELFAAYPAAREMAAALRGLGIVLPEDELSEDEYWRDDGLAFTFFAPYRRAASPQATFARGLRKSDATDAAREHTRADEIAAILKLAEEDPAGDALVRFLQRKVLLEVYKLDPEHMVYLTQQFGPIDWRAVDSQSLYWTSRGLIAGGETVNSYLNDKVNTARILFFSLRNLFLFGRILFEPNDTRPNLSYLNRGIEPAFAEPLNQAYMTYGRLIDPETRDISGAGDTFRSGHVNFLTEIIRTLYLAGLEAEAQFYYDYLRDTYPTTLAGTPNPAFQKNLHEYITDSLIESVDVPGIREMVIVINGFLLNAYEELASGNVQRYARLVRRAHDFYEDYMSKKRQEGYERLRLPPFEDMQVDAFATFLRNPSLGEAETIHKVHLWHSAPLYLRQAVYDALLPEFTAECDYFGFDVQKAFPEPTGMDEYRQQRPQRSEEESEDEVETLPAATG